MGYKLLLCSSKRLVRDGLQALLSGTAEEIQVTGCTAVRSEAMQQVRALRPDVVALDAAATSGETVDELRVLLAEFPGLKVVVLNVPGTKSEVEAVAAAGPRGILTDDAGAEDLVQALRCLALGQSYLCPVATRANVSAYLQANQQSPSLVRDGLTAGEVDVLKLLGNGASIKEIASELSVSTKTVEARRKKLMGKIGANSLAAVIKYAIRNGLVSLGEPL